MVMGYKFATTRVRNEASLTSSVYDLVANRAACVIQWTYTAHME